MASLTAFYWFLLFLIVVCSGSLTTVGIRLIVRDWHKTYLIKRHRNLIVVSISITVIIQFCYLLPHCVENAGISNPSLSTLNNYSTAYLLIPCLYAFLMINFVRYWILYFDFHMSKFNLEKIWKSAIDPAITHTNWFIRHESTLGSSHFLLGYGFIFWCVGTSASVILRGVYNLDSWDRFFNWLVISLFVLGVTLLWWKLREYHSDNLFIKKELMYSFVSGVLFVSGAMVMIFLYTTRSISYDTYSLLYEYMATLLLNVALFFVTLMPRTLLDNDGKIVDLQCKWCHMYTNNSACGTCGTCCCDNNIHEFGARRKVFKIKNKRSGLSGLTFGSGTIPLVMSGNSSEIELQSSIDQGPEIGTYWYQIVTTPFGFESFMNYLSTEFSIENLLFISEYIQIKDALLLHFDTILSDIRAEHRGTRFTVQLPFLTSPKDSDGSSGQNDLAIPTSAIAKRLDTKLTEIETNHKIADPFAQTADEASFAVCDAIIYSFVELYIKYVCDKSQYMINIQSKTSHTLRNLLDTREYDTLSLKRLKSARSKDGDAHRRSPVWQGSANANSASGSNQSNHSNAGDEVNVNVWDRFRFRRSVTQKPQLDLERTIIKEMLKRFYEAEMEVKGGKVEGSELITFVLVILIKRMEVAVNEVSLLMNDSYIRFKRNSNVYDKAVELAMAHKRKVLSSRRHGTQKSLYSSISLY